MFLCTRGTFESELFHLWVLQIHRAWSIALVQRYHGGNHVGNPVVIFLTLHTDVLPIKLEGLHGHCGLWEATPHASRCTGQRKEDLDDKSRSGVKPTIWLLWERPTLHAFFPLATKRWAEKEAWNGNWQKELKRQVVFSLRNLTIKKGMGLIPKRSLT